MIVFFVFGANIYFYCCNVGTILLLPFDIQQLFQLEIPFSPPSVVAIILFFFGTSESIIVPYANTYRIYKHDWNNDIRTARRKCKWITGRLERVFVWETEERHAIDFGPCSCNKCRFLVHLNSFININYSVSVYYFDFIAVNCNRLQFIYAFRSIDEWRRKQHCCQNECTCKFISGFGADNFGNWQSCAHTQRSPSICDIVLLKLIIYLFLLKANNAQATGSPQSAVSFSHSVLTFGRWVFAWNRFRCFCAWTWIWTHFECQVHATRDTSHPIDIDVVHVLCVRNSVGTRYTKFHGIWANKLELVMAHSERKRKKNGIWSAHICV